MGKKGVPALSLGFPQSKAESKALKAGLHLEAIPKSKLEAEGVKWRRREGP